MSKSLSDPSPISVLWESTKQNHDFHELLSNYQYLYANVCKNGDPLLGGRLSNDSGFSATIIETDSVEELQSSIADFIQQHEKLIVELDSVGAQTLISISVGVGDFAYARIFKLGPDFLVYIGNKGISLRIVVCLVSD